MSFYKSQFSNILKPCTLFYITPTVFNLVLPCAVQPKVPAMLIQGSLEVVWQAWPNQPQHGSLSVSSIMHFLPRVWYTCTESNPGWGWLGLACEASLEADAAAAACLYALGTGRPDEDGWPLCFGAQLPNGKDGKHTYTLQFLNLYLSSLNKRHISMDWTLVSWGLPEKATITDSTALTCLARSGLSSLVRWPSSVLWDKSQSMWLSWPPLWKTVYSYSGPLLSGVNLLHHKLSRLISHTPG